MKKWIKIAGVVCTLAITSAQIQAQELFVYTEPASNMPSKSVGVRLTNRLMHNKPAQSTDYSFAPEIMWGVNKNLMLHAEGFFNNQARSPASQGGGIYAKYRFFTADKKNRHFRMAAYGRAAINNGMKMQEEIETNGNNAGYELGLIGTQLLYKQAISASVSFEQALDNGKGNNFPAGQKDKAINYSLSTGRLLLPKKYINYRQTNLNVLFEVLGQTLPGSGGKTYVDMAPSVQLIFNSQARLDIGYKKQLYSNMLRTAPDGFLLRFEYLIFDLLGSK